MRQLPEVPPALPDRRAVADSRRAPRETFEVQLETVTPVLGGGVRTRDIDRTDIIRVPTIRGHLRFWWRALYRSSCVSPDELFRAEKALWGGATDARNDEGSARSAVEVRAEVTQVGEEDPEDVFPYETRDHGATPGAYALWPARKTKSGDPIAPRRLPGTQFKLVLSAPAEQMPKVRAAVTAWVLFGGYGGRTRRGIGSLTVRAEPDQWLPAAATGAELERLLGIALGERDMAPAVDCPTLSGARLVVSQHPGDNAMGCWTTALKWLSDFRQGAGPHDQHAREPDPTGGNRPGRSRWPEADKVRHLSPGNPQMWAHPPQHNGEVVWPRAGFGLPILGQFQKQPRRRGDPEYREPRDFELHWLRAGQDIDRLASPLIVKALPLADGRFVACALWLHRAYPAGGRPALRATDPRATGSSAEFDVLEAPDETARFSPLRGHTKPTGYNLRQAFFGWLQQTNRAQEVV
ncbi:MAG: type III-B CRISPR module RAMP protein Cmr1 [Fimbriimonadaceae bacterium]|nr:type III-B CRISPR module RAMP protein Cmr1 [Fimbriimonadaceae bacterium]